MSICCNCKKETLLGLYVCGDCFEKVHSKGKLKDNETQLYRDLLIKACSLLKEKGFEVEAKAIEVLIERK